MPLSSSGKIKSSLECCQLTCQFRAFMVDRLCAVSTETAPRGFLPNNGERSQLSFGLNLQHQLPVSLFASERHVHLSISEFYLTAFYRNTVGPKHLLSEPDESPGHLTLRNQNVPSRNQPEYTKHVLREPVDQSYSRQPQHCSAVGWTHGRENYQVWSVQYCAQQLCTVQCTHIRTDLAVLWIGFCLTGPNFTVLRFIFVYVLLHACVVL